MKRELLVFFLVSAVIISLFLVMGDLDQSIAWIENWSHGRIGLSALIVALLVLDVFLPIPSSIVMIMAGTFLGPLWGIIVNWIGIMASNVLGYWSGRFWPNEAVDGLEKRKVEVRWYGLLASRGVPVLAESLAITAGVIKFPFRSFITAAALGNLPYCLLYGLSGYFTFKEMEMAYAFGFNILLVGVLFLIGKYANKSISPKTYATQNEKYN